MDVEVTAGLREHFQKMMDACANYVEPTTYIARHPSGENCKWNTEFAMPTKHHAKGSRRAMNYRRDQAFIRDIIYMLDGPEQRQALAAQATEGDGWEQVGFWKQKYEDKAVELQSLNDTFLPKYQTALNTVNTQATDSEKHRNDLYDKVMDQLATIGSQGRKIDAQATELAELRAENDALRKMTDPTWFYFGNDQSSDQCRFSVHEVIDEDFCWDNRKTGEHVIEIATAGPLPTIWAHVKFLTDEEKDAAETDEDYILTEFSTEEEARTLLAKHGGGDAG